MKKLTRYLVLATLAIAPVQSSCTSDNAAGPAPDTTAARDTVWITSDTVFAGDTAEIFLILINPDSAIASINVWLQSSDSAVVYDTIEVLPARFPVAGMLWQSGRHDSLNLMSLLAFTNLSSPGNIPAGAGAIMRLTYATSAFAAPGRYTLDTSSVLLKQLLPDPRPLDIAYPSGIGVPEAVFIPGEIVIQ